MIPASILSLIPIPLPHSIPLQIRKLYKYTNALQSPKLLSKEAHKESISEKLKRLQEQRNKISQLGYILP